MRSSRLVVLLCFMVILAGIPAASSGDNHSVIPSEDLSKSVVSIFVYDWRGQFLRQGTGFFINDTGEVVTCRHLLEEGSFAEVVTVEGEILIIEKVFSEDTETDLIRIGLDFPPEKPSCIRGTSSLPAPGDRVTVAGDKSLAIVSAVRMVPVYGSLMRIQGVEPLSGAGSPVFNENGELVGIVMFQLYGRKNVAWAMPASKFASVMASKSQPVTHYEWSETQVGSWFETSTGSYLLGLAHYWEGEYLTALEFLNRVTDDDRYNKVAFFLIGCCNEALKRYQESESAYSMAVLFSPHSHRAHLQLAKSHFENGNIAASLKVCRKSIRLKSNDPEAFLLLNRVYKAMGQEQQAEVVHYIYLNLSRRMQPAGQNSLIAPDDPLEIVYK